MDCNAPGSSLKSAWLLQWRKNKRFYRNEIEYLWRHVINYTCTN